MAETRPTSPEQTAALGDAHEVLGKAYKQLALAQRIVAAAQEGLDQVLADADASDQQGEVGRG